MNNPIAYNEPETVFLEQDSAEQAVERFSQFSERILDSARVWIEIVDREMNVLIWNKAAEEISGYSRQDVVGHDRIWSLLYPDKTNRTKVLKKLRMMQDGSSEDTFETMIQCKDETKKIISWNFLNLTESGGTASGFIYLGRDITANKKIEDSLRRSEARIRAIMDNVFDGILTVDGKGTIESFSRAAENIFGYTVSEVIGRKVDLLIPEAQNDHYRPYIPDHAPGGEAEIIGQAREVVGRQKDGTLFPLEIGVTEFWLEDRRLFTGIVRDISERKLMEEEKKKLQDELMQAEKSGALGRVAAAIAHEINNPAAVIRNDVSLLKQYIEQLPDSKHKKKILEIIGRDDQAVTRISDIVGAVKGSYRPGAWHLIDVNHEIDAQLILLHKEYKNKIKIVKEYSLLPQIKAFGSEIGQVILNLLTNAIDSIADQGTIEISTHDSDSKKITINIKDSGTGIPKDVLPQIFEPFYTTKEVGKGTGLGLSTSKQIAQKHNGRLYVAETRQGQGTTFVLELPKEA